MRWSRLAVLCLASAAFTTTLSASAADTPLPPPLLRAPKMAKPPVIDGVLSPGEWNGAAMFRGVEAGYHGRQTLMPPEMDVAWWLGYDDNFLYLAMRSPHAAGTVPKATIGKPDDGDILFDDHIEFQLSPFDRKVAADQYFFKIMLNPLGTVCDQQYHILPGQDGIEWDSEALVKCAVAADAWVFEMAIPVSRLLVKTLEGRPWLMQLVRADAAVGNYYCGWVGRTWMEWPEFPEVVFDPEVPAIHLDRLGNLVEGDLDAAVSNHGTAAGVTASLTVKDKTGKALFGEERAVPAGGQAVWKAAGLPISPENNRLLIEVRGAGDKILYRASPQFHHWDAKYREVHYEPWLKYRPKLGTGDTLAEALYFPYPELLKITTENTLPLTFVDPAFHAVTQERRQARTFTFEVVRIGGGSVAKGEGRIAAGVGQTVAKLPLKEPGAYEVRIDIVGGDGKILESLKREFIREFLPWERNQLGKERFIIPPYGPLRLSGDQISTWATDYTVGAGGLLDQVKAKGRNVLKAPIRLTSKQGGKEYRYEGGKPELTSAKGLVPEDPTKARAYAGSCEHPLRLKEVDGYEVAVKSSGKCGALDVAVTGTMEFDGYYNIKLDITPSASGAEVESLELDIPFQPSMDTMWMQREWEPFRAGKVGAVPAGGGVVWQSSSLAKVKNCLGTFVPVGFVGDGERGLWWYAESDQGWHNDDNDSSMLLIREKDALILRVKFIGKPLKLAGKRTIEFALLAKPAKPQSKNYRRVAWYYPKEGGEYVHDVVGYRFYGNSVNGFFLNNDSDFTQLRQYFTDPSKIYDYSDLTRRDHKNNERYGWPHFRDIGRDKMVNSGVPFCLYGNVGFSGLQNPEFKTFAAEWAGVGKLAPGKWCPAWETRGRHNYQNTVTFSADDQLAAFGGGCGRWVESTTDCYLWYMEKYTRLVGVNGTFWDCDRSFFGDEPLLGRAYVRDDGKTQGVCVVKTRRELGKRLATMRFLAGKPSFEMINMDGVWSFAELCWHCEGDFYLWTKEKDLMDMGLDVDFFRGLCAPDNPHMIHPDGLSDAAVRNLAGNCLLHDAIGIGAYPLGANKQYRSIVDGVQRSVGYFDLDRAPEFIPYYRKPSAAVPEDGRLVCSLYARDGKVLAVVLNQGEQDLASAVKIDARLLGGAAQCKLSDAETGTASAVTLKDGSYRLPVTAARHDVKLLLVESERASK